MIVSSPRAITLSATLIVPGAAVRQTSVMVDPPLMAKRSLLELSDASTFVRQGCRLIPFCASTSFRSRGAVEARRGAMGYGDWLVLVAANVSARMSR